MENFSASAELLTALVSFLNIALEIYRDRRGARSNDDGVKDEDMS
ncbi:hypothetical protein OG311_37670 (plasmid) [Streptomyces sp. NBC_01343]|nr:hypothetical protein OG311_37670 [Streptomyces sp. NBC_01343]